MIWGGGALPWGTTGARPGGGMARSPGAVLSFWFGEAAAAPQPAATRALSKEMGRTKFWFAGGPEVDEQCRGFAHLVQPAGRGQLEAEAPEWGEAAGRLAQIVLLDQIARNVWRGSAEAFRFDGRAQELALGLLGDECGGWQGLGLAEKVFAVMPLLHSESADLHARCRGALQGLAAAHPDNAFARISLGHLDEHTAVIRRFGRYPHRNRQLGRGDTAAEAAWLRSPECPAWARSQEPPPRAPGGP